MQCPATKQRALARNSNIIEDLGRASYVFSDKTGTLTSNEMRLRGIAVKGVSYGNPDFRRVLLIVQGLVSEMQAPLSPGHHAMHGPSICCMCGGRCCLQG